MNLIQMAIIIFYSLIFTKYSTSFSCSESRWSELTCIDVHSSDQLSQILQDNCNNYITVTNSTINPLGVLLAGCDNVWYLYLSNVSIKIIVSGAFDNLEYLESISLDHNEIMMLSNMFSISKADQSRLEYADFSFNILSTINVKAFQGLTSLKSLNLHHNNLTKLEPGVFHQDLRNLQKLYISANRLVILDKNIFQKLSSLIYLDLQQNSITNLEPGLFQNLNQLQRLYISANRLVILDENIFQNLTSLIDLDLQENNISKLEPGLFQNLILLEKLNLACNYLTKLEPSVFHDLTSLKYLNLSYNKIDTLLYGTFDGLEKLNILDISGNGLVDLYQFTFRPLSRLTELWFNDNKICSFDIKSLKVYHRNFLVHLSLDKNPWECTELIRISEYFQIIKGNSFDVENFRGIACTGEKNKSKLLNDFELFQEAFIKKLKEINKDLENLTANVFLTGNNLKNYSSSKNFGNGQNTESYLSNDFEFSRKEFVRNVKEMNKELVKISTDNFVFLILILIVLCSALVLAIFITCMLTKMIRNNYKWNVSPLVDI